jgi:ferritin
MKKFRFRHTENQNKKMLEMIEGINKSLELEHTIQQEMQNLANIEYPCSNQTIDGFITDLMGDIDQESKRYEQLFDSIEYEVDELGENGWGLFQGVTRYTNHVARTKNRDNYLVFGAGEDTNRRAFEIIQFYDNRRL